MKWSNLLGIFKKQTKLQFDTPKMKSQRCALVVQYISNHYQLPAKCRNDKRSYGRRLSFTSINPQVREIKFFNDYFIDNHFDSVASIENGYLIVKVVE